MKRSFGLGLVVVSFFCFASCSLSVPSPAAAGEVFLVSIGIDYSSSKVSTLQGTVADACETALCLADIYEARNVPCTVDVLTSKGEKSPSAANIMAELEALEPETQENDLVVFYFSGHGGVDAKGAFLAGAGSGEGDEVDYTKLYMGDLFETLSAFPCRSVVILDCCYAGSMAAHTVEQRSFANAVATLFSASETNRVAVIASSLAEQNSLVSAVYTQEGDGESHSLFTAALLKALGWVHSSTKVRELEEMPGVPVYGYLQAEPGSMTVNDLYEAITRDWTSDVQIPQINRTNVPVKMIP